MRVLRAAAVSLCASLICLAPPASGQELRITDEVGDAEAGGMDIVAVTFDNADFRMRVIVRVDRVRRGSLDAIYNTDRRHRREIYGVAATWRGDARPPLLRVARFTRDGSARPIDCSGSRSRWDLETARVVFSVPSRCLEDGVYGAVRAGLLSEDQDFRDSDFAPDEGTGDGGLVWTDWIPRG